MISILNSNTERALEMMHEESLVRLAVANGCLSRYREVLKNAVVKNDISSPRQLQLSK